MKDLWRSCLIYVSISLLCGFFIAFLRLLLRDAANRDSPCYWIHEERLTQPYFLEHLPHGNGDTVTASRAQLQYRCTVYLCVRLVTQEFFNYQHKSTPVNDFRHCNVETLIYWDQFTFVHM